MTIANRPLTRRRLLRTCATAAAGAVAALAILRAQSNELVIGCAASHTSWMDAVVAPHMRETIGAETLFGGPKFLAHPEKMRANREAPYLSVVQMDDPVMILAVGKDLLRPLELSALPNLADLRDGKIHTDGMWANYVQPWDGVGFNTGLMERVPS